ncbi:MAG: glycoside hydrolase family 3 protein [Deltaproteobacteria bacterium]|nr:glycoside hydrolase family 3 protein [Deltaproteobacteria bacterium]MBW1938718.1 glycoside hydrolase family 3 protein [Deltaproteobacteria bacterium]MBW2350092.1 glycoside hydrolase family 3 protein [Deltaproteobacteria bacterium]
MMRNKKAPLGQLLMIGIPGTDLDPESLSLIKEYGVGNFILFSRNARGGPDKTKKLCDDLNEACADAGLPLPLIAVDQEGEPVQRLGPPFWPEISSNEEVVLSKNSEIQANIQAETAAKILNSLGIKLNLAPVLDLSPAGTEGVLKGRTYGADPREVSILGEKYIQTLQANGVGATAKHFPGIGRVEKDPHFQRPVVTVSKETLMHEMSPFRKAVKAGVKAVMTSHVVFPSLDRDVPATFSKIIVNELLRRELDFKGLLLTDDLEMGGITGHGSLGEAAVRAILAGHDLLLICEMAQKVREALEALDKAWSQGILDTGKLDLSLKRISRLTLSSRK